MIIQPLARKGASALHGIYQKGMCLVLSLEVFSVVSAMALPAVFSTNERLIEGVASGYRASGSGAFTYVGSYGYYWSFAPISQADASFNEGFTSPSIILSGINAYLGYLGKFRGRKMIESTLSGFNTLNTAFAFTRNYSKAIIKK